MTSYISEIPTAQVNASSVRRGVTLMEVLISIGVLSIGLLGVAALMPLAMYKSEQGSSNDRKSLVGRRAFREFRIREMHNPGTANDPRWVAPSGNIADLFWSNNSRFNQKAYCIDPYYLAFGGSNSIFPVGAVGSCDRVSLRQRDGANPPTYLPLDRREAAAIFTSEDDLESEIPKTASDPVVSSMLSDSAGNLAKRYASGRYSWMATLVPQRRDPFVRTPTPNDLYLVSIVVFQNRQIPTPSGVNEPQKVSEFYSSGISGGDLALEAPINGMRVGDWAVLSADAGSTSYLRWYRIVGVDDPDDPDGTGEQNVMLMGPDWPIRDPKDPQTDFTWIRNVVAVYEKTMRIKTHGY